MRAWRSRRRESTAPFALGAAHERRRAHALRPRVECAARRPDDPPDRRLVDAGGDERATLAVTARLRPARGRWSPPILGELAGELQAIGGLFVEFPAATKNPLAMTLQHAPPSAHHRLGACRPRACALALGGLAAVKACRKAKRPVVTSLHGDGARSPPRTSFETAVAVRAISSSLGRNSPPGAQPAFFPTRGCASGSSAQDWIWRNFSQGRVSGRRGRRHSRGLGRRGARAGRADAGAACAGPRPRDAHRSGGADQGARPRRRPLRARRRRGKAGVCARARRACREARRPIDAWRV